MARINRKGKKNGTRGKTKPGVRYVVCCSECDAIVSVDGTHPPKYVTCRNKHITAVVG